MKIDKDWIIIAVLFVIIGFLSLQLYKLNTKTEIQIEQIHKQDENTKRYTAIYYDQTIESLKKTNKDLYDSIEIYKDQIDYLVQFKYQKEFSTGKIDVSKDTIKNEEIKTFEYNSNENDTLKYNLKIGSVKEPNWYSIDFSVSDDFTIINKKINDVNKIDIKTDNGGKIDNTTIIKVKEKKNILNNFAIGPSITCGYDFAKKEPEFIVGFSITYDITDLLKKKK